MTQPKLEEFLIFSMMGAVYALRLTRIREILTLTQPITPLPNNPEWVRGVINLRGEVTPVIDLKLKFSDIGQIYDEETVIMAVKTSDKRITGLVVDSVDAITEFSADQIVSAPDVGSAIDVRYTEGLVRFNGQMVTLLAVDTLLALDEI
jgi:purine-binding chemotaxis protein CheW